MEFPTPKGIETYHTKPYAAIDVSRPEVSAAGKHFAKAGSLKIAITGRRQQILDEAQKKIESAYPKTTVLTLQGDVADRAAVTTAFKKTLKTFGPIDVLVSNAGYMPGYEPIGGETSPDEWWSTFETNDAVVINLTSAAVNAVLPGQSAYTSSKIAVTRLFESFQAENPQFRVVNVAPGVVLTSMHQKTVSHFDKEGWPQLPLDDIELPASYMVWASSPEAHSIKGKFVWANWDVDELKRVLEESENKQLLRLAVDGVPTLSL
ncbi:NAD(P)-binding protein [Cucurbitaria berberidis CBS 394.84]|uniref:NAD(P)-binding protein n=1 Tax=Cucurbitaria berberidis CBS 394.84 TaxID=1168544 RepID=A0A9P4GA25_9PLEO|nr:NAD(P)-binding protein [Cucurbitaria berberidis CBS 394.84]KAF1841631.1 NAD(P)-binding protein [Cucurbitaria berberidis CBS 394.84]